ncbi:MAG: hypothetical protein AB4372_19840 [Xenococcus sp. (in: cyanobacteria)]
MTNNSETVFPSDIIASSELGTEFSGIVEIDLVNSDPVSGIIALPENFINVAIAFTRNSDRDNSFVVTGRGGLPPTPQEFFRGQTILQDWRLSVNSEVGARREASPKTYRSATRS